MPLLATDLPSAAIAGNILLAIIFLGPLVGMTRPRPVWLIAAVLVVSASLLWSINEHGREGSLWTYSASLALAVALIAGLYPQRTDPRCPFCRYDLTGLPSSRCPECGSDAADT